MPRKPRKAERSSARQSPAPCVVALRASASPPPGEPWSAGPPRPQEEACPPGPGDALGSGEARHVVASPRRRLPPPDGELPPAPSARAASAKSSATPSVSPAACPCDGWPVPPGARSQRRYALRIRGVASNQNPRSASESRSHSSATSSPFSNTSENSRAKTDNGLIVSSVGHTSVIAGHSSASSGHSSAPSTRSGSTTKNKRCGKARRIVSNSRKANGKEGRGNRKRRSWGNEARLRSTLAI
mmetsp:Transcript_26375/g.87434  ORF Transcript_26375/g.87434 Transcript_26375/m.87434 type:complete len:243 (+) Transcript_26375:323-1051(+)